MAKPKQVRRSRNGLRVLADPFVVAAPTGARVRTSLKVSAADHAVLWQVGQHLGSLAGKDLAARCALGNEAGGKHAKRADRKRALTPGCSSRWAGTITRVTADQWERSRLNLIAEQRDKTAAVKAIRTRLVLPTRDRVNEVACLLGLVCGKKPRTPKKVGYATRSERWQKQRRLQHLEARLAVIEQQLGSGQVSVVRGGRRLLSNRLHLDEAGLSESEWREQWDAARLFLTADGERDKDWGNETIRVHPEEGWLEIRLPTPLAHLSNTPGRAPTYRLSCDVKFNHRTDDWAAQAASGAVRYDITYNPYRRRWYLDASWSIATTDDPLSLSELRCHRTLGVDLNDGHLACWVIDPSGNPVGRPVTVLSVLDGDTARRDGQLREAITQLLNVARGNGCRSVSIENLDFADARATGRETMGRGKRGKQFRRTVAGIPTAKFRDRLVGMATNRGLAVIAVDPAYTSKWGGQHWLKPLAVARPQNDQVKSSSVAPSRHHAAAVVIGRRSLGHSARRRASTPAGIQWNAGRQLAAQTGPKPRIVRPGDPGCPGPHHLSVGKTEPDVGQTRHPDRVRNRSGPPAGGLTPAHSS